MTKDNKNLIERYGNYIVIVIIVFIFILTYQNVTYELDNMDIGNSTQEQINTFYSECDLKYGVNNWSIYGADYISFDFKKHPPLYFKNMHSYTCLKTGTVP